MGIYLVPYQPYAFFALEIIAVSSANWKICVNLFLEIWCIVHLTQTVGKTTIILGESLCCYFGGRNLLSPSDVVGSVVDTPLGLSTLVFPMLPFYSSPHSSKSCHVPFQCQTLSLILHFSVCSTLSPLVAFCAAARLCLNRNWLDGIMTFCSTASCNCSFMKVSKSLADEHTERIVSLFWSIVELLSSFGTVTVIACFQNLRNVRNIIVAYSMSIRFALLVILSAPGLFLDLKSTIFLYYPGLGIFWCLVYDFTFAFLDLPFCSLIWSYLVLKLLFTTSAFSLYPHAKPFYVLIGALLERCFPKAFSSFQSSTASPAFFFVLFRKLCTYRFFCMNFLWSSSPMPFLSCFIIFLHQEFLCIP